MAHRPCLALGGEAEAAEQSSQAKGVERDSVFDQRRPGQASQARECTPLPLAASTREWTVSSRPCGLHRFWLFETLRSVCSVNADRGIGQRPQVFAI